MPLVWNGSFWRLLNTRSRFSSKSISCLPRTRMRCVVRTRLRISGIWSGSTLSGCSPFKAKQYGLVRAVSAACHRQRTIQFGAHAHDTVEHALFLQPTLGKARCGAHGADGVGGRRANADLENVESADSHRCTAMTEMNWLFYACIQLTAVNSHTYGRIRALPTGLLPPL